uniref:TRAF-type domain-containing protein n=1 Tax=viral metagenome TaxID=1070528 RepID=A0A6C0D120_9ZZZZ
MERKRCLICHEEVRVPVSFFQSVFGCKATPGKRWCYSTVRTCLTCAREYLQLNKNFNQRIETRKCLLCTQTINPQQLQKSCMIYAKDYMYMSMDDKIYPCLHSECSFQGTQSDLDRHLQEECCYRSIKCVCHNFFRFNELEAHQRQCQHYKHCEYCPSTQTVPILLKNYDAHLKRAHGLVVCPNLGCRSMLKLDTSEQQDHIQKECVYRVVGCNFCTSSCMYKEYSNHLLMHTKSQSTKIISLMEETRIANEKMCDMVFLYNQHQTYLLSQSITQSITPSPPI